MTDPSIPESAVRTVKVTLSHRHYGVHREVAETEIPGDFSDYATPIPGRPSDYVVDEDRLLAALPDDFLPCPAGKVLLTIEDEFSFTAQTGLMRFRDWAKYFDAYCLNLVEEGDRG